MTGWRKSSFSGGNTNCVEVGWRKSSYSGENTNCVEIASTLDRVRVRDSKAVSGEDGYSRPTHSRHLTFTVAPWRDFITSLD